MGGDFQQSTRNLRGNKSAKEYATEKIGLVTLVPYSFASHFTNMYSSIFIHALHVMILTLLVFAFFAF